MSLTGKIVIGAVVCFLLIVVGTIGLGTFVWSRYGRGLVAANERQHEQGLAFGRETDEAGCLNEAVARYKRNGGMTGYMGAGIFAGACWTSSRPTDGFCDQVPTPFDLLRSPQWQRAQAERVGIDHQYGGQLFSLQQAHCDSRARLHAHGPR